MKRLIARFLLAADTRKMTPPSHNRIRKVCPLRAATLIIPALAISFAVLTFAQEKDAVAQTAKDLVGTWTLVSVTLEKDGKKTDYFGPNPQGQEMFDPNGRFSLVLIRSDVPKFASNNREQGTTEENQAAVRGSIAYFGTYSVSETDEVITYHIEGSTFPNWRGADQKRLFKISGDELTLTNPGTPSVGSGNASAVLKRAKGSGGDPDPTASPSNQLPPFDGAS